MIIVGRPGIKAEIVTRDNPHIYVRKTNLGMATEDAKLTSTSDREIEENLQEIYYCPEPMEGVQMYANLPPSEDFNFFGSNEIINNGINPRDEDYEEDIIKQMISRGDAETMKT